MERFLLGFSVGRHLRWKVSPSSLYPTLYGHLWWKVSSANSVCCRYMKPKRNFHLILKFSPWCIDEKFLINKEITIFLEPKNVSIGDFCSEWVKCIFILLKLYDWDSSNLGDIRRRNFCLRLNVECHMLHHALTDGAALPHWQLWLIPQGFNAGPRPRVSSEGGLYCSLLRKIVAGGICPWSAVRVWLMYEVMIITQTENFNCNNSAALAAIKSRRELVQWDYGVI